MAAERGIAIQRRAVEHGLQLLRRGGDLVAKCRGEPLEGFAVERMDGEVDAEALLGAIDKLLAEGGADVDIRETLAVAHDRGDAENAEFVPSGFDAHDLLAARKCLHDRAAPCRNVVTENLRVVDAVERYCRRRLEGDQGDALCLQSRHGAAEQRGQSVPVSLGDRFRHRRKCRDRGAHRERRAAFIVDRRDDAVILQLELPFERKLGQ